MAFGKCRFWKNLFSFLCLSLYKENFILSVIRQLLKCLTIITASWCSGVSVIPCPCAWAGSNVLLIASRRWQKWRDITSKIRLHKSVTYVFPTLSLLWFAYSDEATCHIVSCPRERSMWDEAQESLRGTEVLCPIASEELNPAKFHISILGSWFSP